MKYFYILYDSDEIEDIVNFSFGFHGYIDTILGIHENIKSKKINPCKFTNKLLLSINEIVAS